MSIVAGRSRPLVVGHRGSPRRAPENTLAAVRIALDQGADGVEVDVQCSADGELLLFHDAALARLTGSPGDLATTSWRAIRALRVRACGASERVPHLDELFELLEGRDVFVNLELKPHGAASHTEGMAESLALALAGPAASSGPRWVVSSFDAPTLRRFARVADDVPVGALIDRGSTGDWAALGRLDGWTTTPWADACGLARLDAVHPHHTDVNAARMAHWRKEALAVHCWTANDDNDWSRLVRQGVDAIISDVPERLRAYLDRSEVR